MLVRDFNPKGVLYWTGRRCVTCKQEIMDHWLINFVDPDLKGQYWCDKEGRMFSEGIDGCQYDVSDVRPPSEQAGAEPTV